MAAILIFKKKKKKKIFLNRIVFLYSHQFLNQVSQPFDQTRQI